MIALPQWLRENGLEQHLALFEDNDVDLADAAAFSAKTT